MMYTEKCAPRNRCHTICLIRRNVAQPIHFYAHIKVLNKSVLFYMYMCNANKELQTVYTNY